MSRKDRSLKPKPKSQHLFTSEGCHCVECQKIMNSEGPIRKYYKAIDQPSSNDDYEEDWSPPLPSALNQRILPRGGARSNRQKSQRSVPTISESISNASMVHLQSGRIKEDDDTDCIFENGMISRNHKRGKQRGLKVNQLQSVNSENYENIGISSKNIPVSGNNMDASGCLPSIPNNLLANSNLTTFAPMNTEIESFKPDCTGLCEFLKSLSDLKLDVSLGKIEKLIAIQITAALILVVLALTLSVTGAKISSAIFFSAILIVVQLLPTIGCVLLKSQHSKFVFRLSTQMCVYFNVLSSIISWATTSDSQALILLAIATLQYGCFCLLDYYDYKDKNNK